jgi:hypothetical protein
MPATERGRQQIVYGGLTTSDGIPVAVEASNGNTGDLSTLASQITKLKQRFGLTHVAIVGGPGDAHQARIRDDPRPRPPGLDHGAARPGDRGADQPGSDPARPV